MSFSKERSPLSAFYETIDNGTIEQKINNVSDFPSIIELEITNHCNFHCIMCPTGLDYSGRNRGVMTRETFELILKETRGRNVAIKFVGQGESLINPQFVEFAKLAKAQGHVLHLTTNGSLLTDEIMSELIDMEFDSVKFSFQGVDHEGYLVMRQRGDFEELIEKIKHFKQLRGDRRYPFITIGTSVTNESEDQIACFSRYCDEEDVCDKLEIGMTNLEGIKLDLIKDEDIRKAVSDLKDLQKMSKVRLPYCNQVYDVITLRWNGSVNACCADCFDQMVLGNIHKNTIQKLWMCPKEQNYRKILSERRYEDIPTCKNCYDFMGFMGSDNKSSYSSN